MLPLYHHPQFTFRFIEDRIIARFHLEGVEARLRLEVFQIDPRHRRKSGLSGNGDRGRGRLDGPGQVHFASCLAREISIVSGKLSMPACRSMFTICAAV
jgi:hypothetical protein